MPRENYAGGQERLACENCWGEAARQMAWVAPRRVGAWAVQAIPFF